jgi:hypothetical protein
MTEPVIFAAERRAIYEIDTAMAQALEWTWQNSGGYVWPIESRHGHPVGWSPSGDWQVTGLLIERGKVELRPYEAGEWLHWIARAPGEGWVAAFGPQSAVCGAVLTLDVERMRKLLRK